MLWVLLEDQMHRSVSLWIYSSKQILVYSVDKEHHRYQIQQWWGLHGEICFVIQLNLVSERTSPAESHRHPSTTQTQIHIRGSETRMSSAPRRCCILGFLQFWRDRVPGKVVETKCIHTEQQGGVTFLWQCLSRKCNQMAPVLPFKDRKQKERRVSSASSELCIFKTSQSEWSMSQ